MAKIKSFEELKKIKEQVQSKANNMENPIYVRVAMATCGIASGAREIMNTIIEEASNQGLDNVVVTQTGCMSYCYAEPTVEVTLPGKDPVVYGDVTEERAKEIVEKTIKNGELLDGIIPLTHKTIEE